MANGQVEGIEQGVFPEPFDKVFLWDEDVRGLKSGSFPITLSLVERSDILFRIDSSEDIQKRHLGHLSISGTFVDSEGKTSQPSRLFVETSTALERLEARLRGEEVHSEAVVHRSKGH